jgi:hypothetical protein
MFLTLNLVMLKDFLLKTNLGAKNKNKNYLGFGPTRRHDTALHADQSPSPRFTPCRRIDHKSLRFPPHFSLCHRLPIYLAGVWDRIRVARVGTNARPVPRCYRQTGRTRGVFRQARLVGRVEVTPPTGRVALA